MQIVDKIRIVESRHGDKKLHTNNVNNTNESLETYDQQLGINVMHCTEERKETKVEHESNNGRHPVLPR